MHEVQFYTILIIFPQTLQTHFTAMVQIQYFYFNKFKQHIKSILSALILLETRTITFIVGIETRNKKQA